MTKGTDTLYFTYDAFGTPWTVKWNGTIYNYVTNLQGDIIAIVNTSNVAVVEYVYDAWGNVLSISGSMANTLGTLNPLTYRGYVYDHEYGLYYLQSRYYNPEWGRFLNADAFAATGQGMLGNNMFAYCRNNPVSRKDVSGTNDVDCFDSDADPSDDDEESAGGRMGGGGGTTNVGYSTTAIQPYYPPNNGFIGEAKQITLEPNTHIQRTGDPNGRFVAPAGTPLETLSLPYNQVEQQTNTYKVVQPIQALEGKATPWFGQIGGGTQYLLLSGTVAQLLEYEMICVC